MNDETKGAAPEPRCPRCQAVKEPTKEQQQIEGWPCYDPFHEGFAEQARPEPAVKATPPTPELEKQAQAIKDGAHQIGEFLDHLRERGLHLASFGDNDQLYLVYERPEATIAAFYGIDLDKIEQERRALLDYVRSL